MKKEKGGISNVNKFFVLAQQKLAISTCSVKKMKEYLKNKGATKSDINEIISKLKKYSFLDEEGIVKDVISYCDAKHYGYNRIIKMLKDKEVDEKLVVKVIKNESREIKESKEMTKSLIKRYKSKNTVNLKRNIFSALKRYGFDENIASIRVSEVYKTYQEELNVLKLDYHKLLSSYSRKLNGKKLKDKLTDSLIKKGYNINDIRKVENIEI